MKRDPSTPWLPAASKPKCEYCNIAIKAGEPVCEVGAAQYLARKVYHTACFVKETRCYEELAAQSKIVEALTTDKDPRQIDLEECISRAK